MKSRKKINPDFIPHIFPNEKSAKMLKDLGRIELLISVPDRKRVSEEELRFILKRIFEISKKYG